MSAKLRTLTILGISGLFALAFAANPARAAVSPEKETESLARVLKPIPDDRWKEIAGGRIAETYEIAQKDTLWDISQRLFGDPKYWPKIWALNNAGITNPHLIRPGRKIAFMPGTGSELPSISVTDAPPAIAEGYTTEAAPDVAGVHGVGGREEWRQLPKQRWEDIQVNLPSPTLVDPLGFDRRNRVQFAGPKGFDQDLLPASNLLDGVGRIIGARTSADNVTMGDIVYVQGTGDVHEGSVYALTRPPTKLEGSRDGRVGYSYPVLGKIKVISKKGDDYIARVLSARDEIHRGDFLIPVPSRIPELTPVAGPSEMEASLLLDTQRSTRATAQHKVAFVDRGSEDGITPGMVFRVYSTFDPVTRRDLEASDLTSRADIMITQVSPRVSAGVVISSNEVVNNGAKCRLLTDVSSLKRGSGTHTKEVDLNDVNKSDELDGLDDGGALNEKDEKELRQLEEHKDEDDEKVPAPADVAPPPGRSSDEDVPSPEDLAPTAPVPDVPTADELPPPPPPVP